MTTYVSLLRGINVSGQKTIAMPALQRVYEALGFGTVKTYVQSGNVIFDSPESDDQLLAKLIETRIEQTFGFSVPVFIRGASDLASIINGNPFGVGVSTPPATLYVTFLYDIPSEEKVINLGNPGEAGEKFLIGEKEIYLCCPNGYGRTKINNNFFERKLGLLATTRNWKTINALHDLTKAR